MNAAIAGSCPCSARSIACGLTGACASPDSAIAASAMLPFASSPISTEHATMAKSPWRRANSTKAWPCRSPRRRQRKCDARQQLVRLQCGGHIAGGEIGKCNVAPAPLRRHVHRRAEQCRRVDEFRRRIEMAQRAAQRAAIARLPVADVRKRRLQQRTVPPDIGRELDFALPRHGADLQCAVLDTDIGQLADLVEIDQVIGHGKTEIHHRHQRLPAGEHARVLVRGEQTDGVVDAARIVIDKGRGLHAYSFSCFAVGVSGATSSRRRLRVSRPFASQSPAMVRCANCSQVSVQSPSV